MEEFETLTQSLSAIRQVVPLFLSLSKKAPNEGASQEFTLQLNDAVIDMQAAIINSQELVLAAQVREEALNARVKELEESNARREQWVTEKSRYRLEKRAEQIGFVYSLRDEFVNDESPQHDICANCYEEGRKSILQPDSKFNFSYRCPRCFK